jgi:membrane associated rhomboid family serine protease
MIKFLLITNILVFLADTLIFSTLVIDGVSLGRYFTQFFALQHIQTGEFYPWQLLTYQFMHGGIGHLFWNMFALWIFGVELENVWGTRRFAQFYILCGIGAGLIQLATSLLPDAQLIPTVGASGSIFGVLLAFGLSFPNRPIMMFPIFFPIPAKIFVMIYGGIDLMQGIFNPDSGVAHFAHLGGAFFGYMLLKHGDDLRVFSFLDAIMRPFARGEKSIQRKKKRNIYSLYNKKDTSQEYSEKGSGYCISNGDEIPQQEIDRILDKISSTGYKSLSDREKKILYEVSKKI